MTMTDSWGPAHELGHALIEPRWRWVFHSYDRCSVGYCRCDTRFTCHAYETAAMLVSRRLLRAVGCEWYADLEIENTEDYDFLEPVDFARGKALLKRKKLWPVPRTRRTLEAALRRRLGRPRGRPVPAERRVQPPAIRGSVGLGMFQNMLFNPGAL